MHSHSQYRNWLQRRADAGIQRTLASNSVSASRAERRALATLAMSAMSCCASSSRDVLRSEAGEREKNCVSGNTEVRAEETSREEEREKLVGERLHDPRPAPHLSPLLASPHHHYVNVASLPSVSSSPAASAAVPQPAPTSVSTSMPLSMPVSIPVSVRLRRAMAVENRSRSVERDRVGDEVTSTARVSPLRQLDEDIANRTQHEEEQHATPQIEWSINQRTALHTVGLVSSISQPNIFSSTGTRPSRAHCTRTLQAPLVIPEELGICICDRGPTTTLLLRRLEPNQRSPRSLRRTDQRPNVESSLVRMVSLQQLHQQQQSDMELATLEDMCTCKRKHLCTSANTSSSTLRLVPIDMSPRSSPVANHVSTRTSNTLVLLQSTKPGQNSHDAGPWRQVGQVGVEAETEIDADNCYIRSNRTTAESIGRDGQVESETGEGHVRQGRRWRVLRESSAEQEDLEICESREDDDNHTGSASSCCRSCLCWLCGRCVLFCTSGNTNGSTGCAGCGGRDRKRIYVPIPPSMEWQAIAKIMDRTFLYIFFLTTILVWATFMIYGFNRLHDFDDPAGDDERLVKKKSAN